MNIIRRNPRFIWGKLILLSLFSATIFATCNAPHNNPLDPDNPNNNFGTISGVVQTFSLPFAGISGASVYWPSANKLVKTDASGKFVIGDVPMENGKLIIDKEGYRADTVIINWTDSRTISPQVNLNSIPVLDSIALFTSVINQFNPDQTFELDIQSVISDRDNDIDSVKVANAQLNLDKNLDFNISQNYFEKALYTGDLNVTDLEEVIGLDFNINVYDRFKNTYNIGSAKVTRVIKTPIVIQSPSNSDTVNSHPYLTWQRFNPGYPFTYSVEIYTNDFANSQVVVSKKEISSDSTSFYVSSTLQSRDYYWVLWVVDQFRNRARSRPATFTVK